MTIGSSTGKALGPNTLDTNSSASVDDDQCIIDTLEIILQQDWDVLVIDTVRRFYEETKAKIKTDRSADAGIQTG
jgi:hypothetical protein